jgi:uncharacterized membrane protein YdbT with pleckstrin-like domain
MNYVESVLMPGETIVEKAQIHWFIFVVDVMVLLVGLWASNFQFFLAVVIVTGGLAMLTRDVIYYLTTELALTNKRVIAKFGWIQRNTVELSLSRVESLTVNQSIAGRIFNFGTLTINGIGGVQTPIPIIANPLKFRSQTLNLLDHGRS